MSSKSWEVHKAIRIAQLDNIDFVWDQFEFQFEKSLSLLASYEAEFGHCRVPKRTVYKGVKLGSWLQDQRTSFNKGDMPKDRADRLERIGFVWDEVEYNWEHYFAELADFKEKYGDLSVPPDYKTKSGRLLKRWMTRQGASMNSLTPDRIQRLDALGFVWNTKKTHLLSKPKNP